jgi:hypothetical protein
MSACTVVESEIGRRENTWSHWRKTCSLDAASDSDTRVAITCSTKCREGNTSCQQQQQQQHSIIGFTNRASFSTFVELDRIGAYMFS